MSIACDTKLLTETLLQNADFGSYDFECNSGAESMQSPRSIEIYFPMYFRGESSSYSSGMEITVNLERKIIRIEHELAVNTKELESIAYKLAFPEIKKTTKCKKCDSSLVGVYCSDTSCVYSDTPQHISFSKESDEYTIAGIDGAMIKSHALTVGELIGSISGVEPKTSVQIRGTIEEGTEQEDYVSITDAFICTQEQQATIHFFGYEHDDRLHPAWINDEKFKGVESLTAGGLIKAFANVERSLPIRIYGQLLDSTKRIKAVDAEIEGVDIDLCDDIEDSLIILDF